jgi:alanine racemase
MHVQKHAMKHDKPVQMMPVIKANAYGHGATDVAVALLHHNTTKDYVRRFAVNRVSEGVQLRQELVKRLGNNERAKNLPILILGYSLPDEICLAAEFNLTATITERETLVQFCHSLQKMGRRGKIHIKVDTGMGRLGLFPHEVIPFIKQNIIEDPFVQKTPIVLEGLFTHFSVADEIENEEHIQYTRKQYEIFDQLCQQVSNQYLDGKANEKIASREEFLFHCSNSAAICYYPEFHMDMVRPGVSIYGFSPRNVSNDPLMPVQLKPALTFKSHLARVKTLPPNSYISYGRTFSTGNRELKVGLVPVGYGDGYHRLNSNRGYVLVNGKRAPICGRICMDQFVVDLSQCDNAKVNDEVILIGKQGDEEITAEQVASWSETINYEVTTSLLFRAPRIFLYNKNNMTNL